MGGSNAFVRRPFLYTGVLYGLGGALLAWGIVAAAILVLQQPVATLAQLYGSRYVLRRALGPGHRGTARRRGGARLAGGVDLGGAPPARHRAARLRRAQLVVARVSRVSSVASIHLRMRRASATRVRLPKELSSTMTMVRSSITVCITRQRPAREM